ncbi:MFS transporter, partial [Actinomadura adrarensis]
GPLIVNGVLDAQGTPGELVASDYRPALFIMVGVLAVGFVANLLIRPVSERWHEDPAVVNAADRPAEGDDGRAESERVAVGEGTGSKTSKTDAEQS